jgi:diguanylate cyclase (GGDEF)-like protein
MALEADDTAARLHAEFPRALRDGQVVAHYQPEVELSTGRLVAAELLARWEHPELGTLQPALFTSVAEELGLMREFSLVMLRQALVQHRAWADAGWVVPVAVNIGPSCVTDPGFPAAVAQLLREEQVPGQMLTLEVSEETGTAAASTRFFAELAEFEVQVSLDDFGTGYASLESLGGWPINELKLDRSIVRPIISSASFRTIVRTTIDLAHQLGVKVVAEGVESAVIGSELHALGCDIGQGFYLGRPMPAAAFTEWMRDPVRSAARLAPSGYPQARPAVTRTDSGIAGGIAGRLRRGLRRAAEPAGSGTMAAALVMLAAYGLWQVFRWGGKQHQAMIGDLALLPVNIAVVTLSWRVSRRQDLGRQSRRSWRCMAAALTLYMLGDVLQFMYEVVLHEPAYPTWADAAYLSFYVVASFALLSTPRSQRRSGSERARRLLDMGTVFVGGAVLIWYVALGPALAWGAHVDLIDLVTYAYPIGDLLLLFGILSVLWRGVPPSSVLSLRIFAGGILLFIAADVTYDYITVHSTYLGGDPVDTLWMVALTAISLSAAVRLRTKPAGGPVPPQAAASARPSSLPYFAIVSSYLLLVVVGLHSVKFDPLGGILVGALVLTFLVSTRQYLALRDNGRLAARYRELATVDGITGLYNRRHFMEAAEAAFVHAQRTGKPFAALMIDVDRFKQINDTHGHSAGDRVLAELAQLCREHTRPDDIVGRYGGDEFIIMVPGITTLRAIQLADQLIRPSGRALRRDGTPLAYSVSVGIAECPPDADLSLLLMHADLAMYEAKQAGGGCWRIFGDGAGAGAEEAGTRPATVPDAVPDGTEARH